MFVRFATLILAAATLLSACDSINCSSPEDELRASFAKRLPILEKLRAMSNEDESVVRISPTFTWLANDSSWPRPMDKLGFSEARWTEYRRLFKEVGATEGLSRREESIEFTTRACGLGVSGKSFGYAFLAKKPARPLARLDDLSGTGLGHVPLQDNWYLFVWGT